MLASSAAPFDDPRSIFELKYDGIRAMIAIDEVVRVWGRRGQDFTSRYPEVEAALGGLPRGTILDGELVLIRDGLSDFHAVMRRHMRRRPGGDAARYVAFDLLSYGARSLLKAPMRERRALLHELLPDHPALIRCEGVVGEGRRFFAEAVATGHEGVVAKSLTSHYTPNKRTSAWRKIKQATDLPCVVIGYRVVAGRLRSLLMASLRNGQLAYVGAVELGIGGEGLLDELESVRRRTPAVPWSVPARWVKPERFCMVRHQGLRPGGWWRDAVFAGWAT